ncbi:hypothetical protein [Burkholderia ambifaria]|uniref:hypothetical protein n=1 Tax=Burkholderia ambifaria TaxID=152480 RepID=UPI0015886675|nr:hypothetical protein [Burkholderia ambifaria]
MNGFVHGVFDNIVVSTKLLLAGKAAASGNIARQAIEGLAMAVLCSADQEVILRARRLPKRARSARAQLEAMRPLDAFSKHGDEVLSPIEAAFEDYGDVGDAVFGYLKPVVLHFDLPPNPLWIPCRARLLTSCINSRWH